MRALLLLALLAGTACAHKPTEREIYAQGLREGYSMGRAPQFLPIAVNPVSLSEETVRSVVAPLEYGETYPGELDETARKFFSERAP